MVLFKRPKYPLFRPLSLYLSPPPSLLLSVLDVVVVVVVPPPPLLTVQCIKIYFQASKGALLVPVFTFLLFAPRALRSPRCLVLRSL